ncbi:phage tail domain-containing protein [Paenibacillus yanchengensis]|uniref:Phage tail domain-containing protein n=1 Tax=Paenibacillus yanchengensis TaxID=2035833 RepID=A0ABW4YKV2_9BACL
MYGFRYRGRHSSEFGVDLLSYTINSPELREYEEEVPGLPGIVDYGTEWSKRSIDMQIDITPTAKPFKVQQSKILNWFKPTLPAGILVFDEIPDRFYYAKFTGNLGIQQFGTYGTFEFAMKCTDPFIYGPEQIVENTITSNPESIFVVSAGTEPTYPVIRLQNAGNNTINGFSLTIISEVE